MTLEQQAGLGGGFLAPHTVLGPNAPGQSPVPLESHNTNASRAPWREVGMGRVCSHPSDPYACGPAQSASSLLQPHLPWTGQRRGLAPTPPTTCVPRAKDFRVQRNEAALCTDATLSHAGEQRHCPASRLSVPAARSSRHPPASVPPGRGAWQLGSVWAHSPPPLRQGWMLPPALQ